MISPLRERIEVEPLPHRVGALSGFPVGIEEELLIVDPVMSRLHVFLVGRKATSQAWNR